MLNIAKPQCKNSKLGNWVNTDQKIVYTTKGCKSNEVVFNPKVSKRDPCIDNPSDAGCPVVLVPGENAGIEPTTKKTTINCIKGNSTRKVTGIKPKCPTGYKVSK